MANTYLKQSLEMLEDKQHSEAFETFQKAEYQATQAVHVADSFQGFLDAMKVKLLSSTMIGSAVDLKGLNHFHQIFY